MLEMNWTLQGKFPGMLPRGGAKENRSRYFSFDEPGDNDLDYTSNN